MPIGEQDPAQKGITDGDQSPIMTRRQFGQTALTSMGVVGLDGLVSPFRSGAKALGDGANFLIRFSNALDQRDAKLNAWLERFNGLPIEKESFTLFAEKDGRGNTYQLGFTVRDPSLIPDNDKPYTQISIHGVTKDQAKGIAQVFGGTKLTSVGETNLFDRLAKIGGGAGLGALAASVIAGGMSKNERSKLIAEGAAIGAGATALLGGLGVSTTLALLPEEKRRELFDSLLRSINEKLQPIFNIFNGSAGNLQSNEPTPISQAVTATFTPTPSPFPSVTFTPTSTETGTPTPTATAKPSETPTPTETPIPLMSWISPITFDTNTNITWGTPGNANSQLWTDWLNNLGGNGKTEIVDDARVGGKAFKFTVNERRDWGNNFRIYPAKKGQHIETLGNWSMKWKVVFGQGCLPTDWNQNIAPGGVFRFIQPLDGRWMTISAVDIYKPRTPVILVTDPDNADNVAWGKYESRYVLQEEVPYEFNLHTLGDRIKLAVNDEIVTSGRLPPKFIGVLPVQTHAGAYGGGRPPGFNIINGPIEMNFYKSS